MLSPQLDLYGLHEVLASHNYSKFLPLPTPTTRVARATTRGARAARLPKGPKPVAYLAIMYLFFVERCRYEELGAGLALEAAAAAARLLKLVRRPTREWTSPAT